jgi:hypothetical protein
MFMVTRKVIQKFRASMQAKRCRRFYFFGLSVLALAVAGCAHQPVAEGPDMPGIFPGLLHGFLIVFSFIGSLFMDVRIYNFPNSGGWYDFGYVIGAAIFLGGGGASA